MREPGRRLLAAPVLPGEPAACERAERRVPDPVLVAEREDRLAIALLEERERVLHPLVPREPLERGQLERLGELLGREVRRARGADRAGADELVERLQRLLLGDVRVEVVCEVERDPLDAEPARLVSTCRRIRAPPSPRSAPSVIGLKVFVAITTSSRTAPPSSGATRRSTSRCARHRTRRPCRACGHPAPTPRRGAETRRRGSSPARRTPARTRCRRSSRTRGSTLVTATPLRPSARCSMRRS